MKIIEIYNNSNLRDALVQSTSQNVTGLIFGEISLGGETLSATGHGYNLHLIGMTPDAGIRADMDWDGKEWPEPKYGISLWNYNSVIINNLRLSHYEHKGTLLEIQHSKAYVLNCRVEDVRTKWYPARVNPPKEDKNVIFGTAIFGTCPSWLISNCKFSRCIADWDWSHVLYINGEVMVDNCIFDDCGQSCNLATYSGSACITNCTFTRPVPYRFKDDNIIRNSTLWILSNQTVSTVIGNKVSGQWDAFLVGQPHSETVFARNDYSGATFSKYKDSFWLDFYLGKRKTKDEWLATGQDVASRW